MNSICAAVLFVFASSQSGSAEEIGPGTRVVVIRGNAELRVKGKFKGTVPECSAFTVDKVEGPWLWIASQQAYLNRSDVIPFVDAVDHYTREINRTKSADAYWHRAQIWRLKGQQDIVERPSTFVVHRFDRPRSLRMSAPTDGKEFAPYRLVKIERKRKVTPFWWPKSELGESPTSLARLSHGCHRSCH